jgi:4-amino-4-deoxy-L-arabinose transferase-like glycosyltransferase
MGERSQKRISQSLLLAIILVGWWLALTRLGERSFWADEGYTAYLAQRANAHNIIETLQKDHAPLHLFLVIGAVQVSESEMMLRLPSAIATVLVLPVVYLLGCRLFSRVAGLTGAFLVAISPFAVGFAQEARTYALLEFLACLSLLLLLQALERRRWSWWAGFCLATVATLYTHTFGWFVVGAEVAFAALILLRTTWTERRVDSRSWALGLSLLVVAILYMPWLPALNAFWQEQVAPGNLPAGLRPFELSTGFFRYMFVIFGARSQGWPFLLFSLSFSLGLVALVLRKKWRTLVLIVLWYAVPIAGLTIGSSGHFFEYRYLLFILPISLLVTAEGVTGITSLLMRIEWFSHRRQVQPILTLSLVILLFVPANLPALRDHYRSEKENWRNIGAFVRQNLQPDEALYVSPRYWAHPLLYYQPSLEPYLAGGNSNRATQLQSAAEQHAGLWFLRYAGPQGDPNGVLSAWITEQQFELLIDAQACGWGIHVYYRRFDELAPMRQAELLRLAAAFCPSDPRFQSLSD